MVNNRSFSENMKKMRETATEQARLMKARSQQFGNNYQKRITKDRIPEIKDSFDNKDNICNENSKINFQKNKDTSIKKNNFSNILKLLESLVSDEDNALIIILIILLMDDENNFLILMLLFYILI